MNAYRPDRNTLLAILLVASGFAVLTWLNVLSKREAAALPEEYRVPYMLMQYESENTRPARYVTSVDGQHLASQGELAFQLTLRRAGDTIVVTETADSDPIPHDAATGPSAERTIVLVRQFSLFDLATFVFVGSIFLLFALGVALRFRHRSYSGILRSLSIATAAMLLFDWGSLAVHGTEVSFILRLLFDAAIWLLPSLFFHFSCTYPKEKNTHLRRMLFAWYGTSIVGILLSLGFLVAIFFASVPVHDTPYVVLHGTINDVFLIMGLLATVANFEHSALTIGCARERKNVYWVLLGIIFGPLVFVFLILVPRILVGSEFVSDTAMEYTLLFAPAMFWIALRRNGRT